MLYATLRVKRTPFYKRFVAVQLRVAHALPVHTHKFYEEDLCVATTLADVKRVLQQIAAKYKQKDIDIDAKSSALKLLK